jgi:hypothetical protein
MRSAIRTVLAAVLAWCVGAAAAVTLGLVGVSLIGATTDRATPSKAPTTGQPVRPDQRADEAISSPTALASPTSPTSDQPSTQTSEQDRRISSPGGAVLARCGTAGASVVSVSPAPGYRAIGAGGGPAPQVIVSFQSGQDLVRVVVRCPSGMPSATINTTTNDDVGDD